MFKMSFEGLVAEADTDAHKALNAVSRVISAVLKDMGFDHSVNVTTPSGSSNKTVSVAPEEQTQPDKAAAPVQEVAGQSEAK